MLIKGAVCLCVCECMVAWSPVIVLVAQVPLCHCLEGEGVCGFVCGARGRAHRGCTGGIGAGVWWWLVGESHDEGG